MVHNLTVDEPSDTNVQKWIRDYYVSLEGALGSEDVGKRFGGYDSFINDDK